VKTSNLCIRVETDLAWVRHRCVSKIIMFYLTAGNTVDPTLKKLFVEMCCRLIEERGRHLRSLPIYHANC